MQGTFAERSSRGEHDEVNRLDWATPLDSSRNNGLSETYTPICLPWLCETSNPRVTESSAVP